MKLIAAAVAASALICGVAEARTVTYEYFGGLIQDQSCDTFYGFNENYESCSYGVRWVQGKVIFDLARIPGDSLANSSIGFSVRDLGYGGESGETFLLTFDFSGPAGSIAGERIFDRVIPGDDLDWSWTPLVGYSSPNDDYNDFRNSFNPMFYDTDFHMSFGGKSQVIAWHMSGIEGGNTDWYATSAGHEWEGTTYWDGDGVGSATSRGKWTKVGTVPLPASAFALLAALGALGATRARRRQAC